MAGIGLVTEAELAEILDLTIETVRKYTQEQKIPSIEMPNGEHRYYLDAVVFVLTGELPFYRKSPLKTYCYQDYLEFPDEYGYRFEILDGKLIRTPSPSVAHQRVTARLVRILDDYFCKIDPRGEIFPGPLDVTFHETTVTKPDIIYVSGQQKSIIKDTRIDGAPNLIVEVTSKATRTIDEFKRLQLYLREGVLHYWLVDFEVRSVLCFALRKDKYAVVAMGKDDDVIEHPDFASLVIPLHGLWSN